VREMHSIVRRSHELILAIAICGCSGIPASAQITVSTPTQISPPESGGHWWGAGNTYASPDDPNVLITCGIRSRLAPLSWEVYLYTSKDGGVSWSPSYIDNSPSDSGLPNKVSEAGCAIGRNGTIYLNSSTWGRKGSEPLQVYRSLDAGATWSRVATRKHWHDATKTAVDASGGRRDGNLYVFSNGAVANSTISGGDYEPLLTSSDGGKTFVVGAADRQKQPGNGLPAQVIVLADGRVLGVKIVSGALTGASVYRLVAIGSADGGRSLFSPVEIASWPSKPRSLADLYAGLAVDRSKGPHAGRVYVAWRHVSEDGHESSINACWSDDGGTTWSTPISVVSNTGTALIKASESSSPATPAIAVDPNGNLGVLWSDKPDFASVRFSVSRDGGKSFAAPVTIYSAPGEDGFGRINAFIGTQDFPLTRSPQWEASEEGKYLGERTGFALYLNALPFVGLVTTIDGRFHAVWNRGNNGSLWAAQIDLSPRRKSTVTISQLRNISNSVRVLPDNMILDAENNLLFVDISLQNISKPVVSRDHETRMHPKPARADIEEEVISGDLYIDISRIESQLGFLRLIGGDEISDQGRTLVNMRPFLRAGMLRPGEKSGSKRLTFKLERKGADAVPSASNWQLLDADVDVYAKKSP
jgi:hypothetical protein